MKVTRCAVLIWSLMLLEPAYAIKPNEINWDHHLGQDPNNPAIEYSLVSTGYLRAELSSDFATVMATWLKDHPEARMIPVITRGPMNERVPNSKLIFVWIVDRDDILNVYLVRHGCVGAAQMFSFADKDFDQLRDKMQLDDDKLQVPQKEYDKVKKRLIAAEKLAEAERLGIWANPESNVDHTRD